jgi:hypothetical protein
VPGQPFDVKCNIKALLRIISPINCSISRTIPDLATPLMKKKLLTDFLGGTIKHPHTAWMMDILSSTSKFYLSYSVFV